MELNQNLADFFPNNKQGSGDEGPKPSASPGGLSLDLANFFPSQAAPRARALGATSQALDESVVTRISDAEGLSPTQKRVMTALLHQESGFGRNARTSVDGAQGAGQIIPATFQRYAKPGERIDDQEHNLAVMARIVKDLGTKFGDDPARIATGYFSGEGNVNRGSGQAWRNDAADGNRKRVSSYVSDVLGRLSGIPEAQAAEKPAAPKTELPDLGKAKPWAEIAKNPEYQALDDATKAQAKAAYFDYWIAPHAGGNARQIRQQFLGMKDPTPGLMERAGEMAGKVGEAIKSVLPGMDETAQGPTAEPTAEELEQASKPAFNYRKPGGRTPAERDPNAINMPGSVMDGTVPQDNTLPTTSKAPVRPEVRAAFNARWDAATPEQRATMAKQEGVMGQLARERAGIFARQDELAKGMPADNALRDVDPRIEARRAELISNGEDARVADTIARVAAGRGVLPGQEIAAVGVMQDGSGTRQGQIMQMQADLKNAPQGEKPEGAEVATNAIMRGIHQSAATGKGLIALGAKSVGADELALDMLKGYFSSSAKAKGYSAQIEDFTKIEKISDVPTYVLEAVLENLPQLAVSIGSGGVGGLLARKFGEKAVTRMVAEQAAKELARRTAIGAATGAGIASIGMESGSIYGDIARETGQERPGVAAGFGIVAGALDAIPAFRAATKILGTESVSWATKEIAKRYGKEALVQLGGEGFTEFLQTWVEKGAVSYVDGRPLFTKENLVEAVDAFLKGGAAGAVIGVGSQGVSDIRNAPDIRADRAAERARTDALNKWNTQGFVQTGRVDPASGTSPTNLTEDGRIEPTMGVPPTVDVAPAEPAPIDVNPMVQTADSIVTELAGKAGVPLETVLPSSPQQTTGPAALSDDEIIDRAEMRAAELWQKASEDNGLTPEERSELDALQQAQGNPVALRKLYGFDQASSTAIPSNAMANQTFGQTPAPPPGQTEQPAAGQVPPATMEPGLVAAQSQENANVQTQISAQQDGIAQPPVGSDGQPGGPAPVQEPAAQAAGTQVGAESGQRYEGVPAEDAVSAEKVAIQAAQIARRESPISSDPRIDRIGAQENYLQELARSNPEVASSIAQELRNNQEQYAEAAGVSPEMIGRYASVIEKQLSLAKPKTEKEARAKRAQQKEAANGTQAAQAQQAETQGSQAPAAPAVAPKTEREAREARRKTDILTPDGGRVAAQWDVVDADSVKASLKEGVSQPRDRMRSASNAQVLEIAGKPDFDRLSDTSKTMDYGAPTLSADGLIVGGNGRFEGVSQAYEGGKASGYLDSLLKSAGKFGLDPEAIRGMKKPILVRRITQEADTRKLAIQSNQAAGLQMSDMEQAALDAERMKLLDQVEVSDTGDIPLTSRNMQAIQQTLGGYATNELAGMMTADGGLSQSGMRRLRNAILFSAYGKSDTLARLIESPDADMKNIGTALVRAGAQLAKVRRSIAEGGVPAEYDISADLTAAIETLSSLRASGVTLADYLAQNDMFGGGISAEAKAIIQFLNDNLRSAKSISEYLNAYAQAVLSAEGASGGLFDDVTLPSKLETLKNAGQRFAAEKAAAKSQQSIFDQPAGKTGQQDRQQSEGQTGNARSDEEGAGQVTQSSQKEKAPAGQTGKQAMPDSTQPFAVAVSSEPDTLRRVPDTLDQAKEKYAQKVEKNANNQNELSNSVPITDFGKKIGGAKKDLWGAFSDNMGKVSDEDIGNQPLSKSWPEPDYQALLDGGADPWAVAFMHATRDAIPAKPRTGYKVKQWADLVRDLRRHSINLASGKMPVDRIKAIIDSMRSSVMRDISGRIDLYLAVGHSKSLAGVSIGRGEYSIFHGVEYKPAKVIWSVEKKTAATAFSNFPRMLATGSTRDEAIQKFKDKFASMEIAKPAAKEVSFDVWSTKGQPGFKVGKKVGRNYILLAGPFDTVKEARAYRDNHQADLVAKLEKAKEIPQERRDTNNPRVGEDMRGGQDVTPEMFGEAFGFRGVEFGNWVDQGRRQKDLNEAYDALMDMAAIIGVNPKALSLNGELGIAFGARGSGGVHPAAAHYEPDYVVINLTKKSGAGSLGHEWWHALDNYFSRMRKQGSKMMTEALDVSLAARGSKFEAVGDVRREMIAAFGEVMRSIRTTAIKARSSKLDSKRTKEYWTTDAEMSARAFESYLISKLQDQNASNDYLANIVDEKTWAAAEKLGFELDGSYPYPTAGEVPAIRAGFDAFFDTIEQKETDSGVMLYNLRRSQTSTPEFKKWFGDSKVVDADGKPLVVYHGTASDFNVFNTGRGAIYFAADKDAAQAYANYNEDGDSGPRVVNAYLRIENPMVIDKKWADKNITDEDGAIDWTALDNVAYEAGQNGHDGLILKGLPDFAGMNENDKRVEREYDQYIVFNPTQIKSATGNNGQFDANDPNITRDISRSPSYHFEGTEQTKRVNALAKLKALEEKRNSGKITDAEYRLGVQQLIAGMENQKDERAYRQVVNGRRRGTDWIIAKLRRGLADGTVPRNEVEFAEWLFDQNPNLGNDLGVSVKAPNNGSAAGQYNPASSVMTLMLAGEKYGDTTVHEIMHHAERMMPPSVQDAILKEWQRAWDAAYKAADEKLKAALDDMLAASLGNKEAHQRVVDAMMSGTMNYADHYQLYSPSEFWAVNSTRILSGRYKADASWVKRAIQWFKEFVQRARGFLGLRSDAPIIKALNRVMNGEGYFQTNASMLVQQDIAQWRNEKKADQKQDSTKDLTVQNLNPQAIDEANTALSTSGTLAFSRFTERFGTGPVNHAEAKIAAEELTGLHLGIEAVPNSDLPSDVPMRLNLKTRQIEFDPNREMTQAFAVQSYIEELLHAVDVLSSGRAISVTSTRLHPETGDIGQEATRAYNTGPNALKEFLDYPLNPAIGLNYPRIRAELFARLGVMYFADPGLMKELMPNAHQSYEQLFGVKQTGPTEYVRGKIWLPVPSANGGQVRGKSRSDEYAQNDARGIGQNEQTRRGLERLRAGIGKAFQANPAGGVVQSGFFETRQTAQNLNQGAFQPGLPLNGGQGGTSWQVGDSGRKDDFVYRWIDKNIDLKRVQEAIRENANIIEQFDAYQREELYHGRVAVRAEKFMERELRPLLMDMRMKGISLEKLEAYLWARHATERNAQIARINNDMPDGGSGLTNDQVREYFSGNDVLDRNGEVIIEGLRPDDRRHLDALAARVDAINAGTKQVLLQYGLETPGTIQAWDSVYSNYVPLHREDMDGSTPIGQGFSVKGSASKRATGSKLKVVDIIGNIALQREAAITRGEKNRVGLALYGLALQNQNKDFWDTDLRPMISTINKDTGMVQRILDPKYKNLDNVLMVRVGGQDRAVVFNKNNERAMRMAESMKNLDVTQLDEMTEKVAVITRYFASINTQYNVVFGLVNGIRDVQAAALNLSSTELRGKQAQMLANVPSALRAIWGVERGDPATSDMARLYEEMRDAGGTTGYREIFRLGKDRTDSLIKEINRLDSGNTMKVVHATLDVLDAYNTSIENATRLAAYKLARGSGMSKEKAASIAKNITVNFNRKGKSSRSWNGWYAFFNASVQGSARTWTTLTSPAGKRIMAGGLALGVLQALVSMITGMDDDDWEAIPDFIKMRNIIIPTSDGKYIQIPMPLGYNIIPNISRIATELFLSGGKNPGKKILELATVFLDNANPLGSSTIAQTMVPTIADPIVALAENKNFAGQRIYKENIGGREKPGFTRSRDSSSAVSRYLAEGINNLTGGDKYKPGMLSPTPDQLDYIFGTLTGGVGRELLKAYQATELAAYGERVPLHRRPIINRFYGSTEEDVSQSSRYYRNMNELNALEDGIKGRRRDRVDTEAFMRENPESSMIARSNAVERLVNKWRQERHKVEFDAKMSEADRTSRLKELDARIIQKMREFNQEYSASKKAR